MFRSTLILLALVTMVPTGCQPLTDGGDVRADTPSQPTGLMSVPKWQLAAMAIDGAARPKLAGRATISFSATEANGNAGCNHFSGDYTARADGTFATDGFMMTEMGCDLWQQESDFIAVLTKANHFEVESDNLVLSDGTKANMLRFVPYQPNHLPLQGTRWTVTHFTESDETTASATMVTSDPEVWLQINGDKVTGSGGCNQFHGGVKLADDGTIQFQPIASTRKACNEKVNQQEFKFFELLPQMTKYTINESTLTFSNADGTLGLQ